MTHAELDYMPGLRRGSRGAAVRKVQEWLSLQGFAVVTDGAFGPATEFGLQAFQHRSRLPVTGRMNRATFRALTTPLAKTLQKSTTGGSLRTKMRYYARLHLRQRPRETGGQNRGPWVRAYMSGHEGVNYPWCAGFVCTVLTQACAELGLDLPIRTSTSCDRLAQSAESRDRFLRGRNDAPRSQLKAGDIFLARATAGDWTHTGIVMRVHDEVMLTIEGNTNGAGSREGYEVCQRIRSYRRKDFILLANPARAA